MRWKNWDIDIIFYTFVIGLFVSLSIVMYCIWQDGKMLPTKAPTTMKG